MKRIVMALAAAAFLFSACASATKAKIPSKMLPHDGKTSARAAGMGEGAIFAK